MRKKCVKEENTGIIYIAGVGRGAGATSLAISLGLYISLHHNENVLCEEDFKAGERVWFKDCRRFRECTEGIYRYKKFYIKKRGNFRTEKNDISDKENYAKYKWVIKDCGIWQKDVFNGCGLGIIRGGLMPWVLKQSEEAADFYGSGENGNLLCILGGNAACAGSAGSVGSVKSGSTGRDDGEFLKFKKKYGINCIRGMYIQNPFQLGNEELKYLYMIFELAIKCNST